MIRRLTMASLFAAVMVSGWAALSGRAGAGEYNETLSIGDRAPAWKDLPGVDGRKHSLSEIDAELVVVVFTCNSCPIAADYEDRIMALAKKYAAEPGKLAVVAINVNLVAEDSLPKMKQRAEQKGFPFAYLFDESQKIAKDYGAAFTPEFFVLDKDRRVAYTGGMDDSSDPARVKIKYLEPAIEATFAGKKPQTQETVARGCRIRYAPQRKRSKEIERGE
ncbi:MAG TPA: thioredoxin family protein [Pirellulales bacterium]|nr:thioredoxin family protein [Pirellulales bacterium]